MIDRPDNGYKLQCFRGYSVHGEPLAHGEHMGADTPGPTQARSSVGRLNQIRKLCGFQRRTDVLEVQLNPRGV